MISLAICDDEPLYVDKVEALINKFNNFHAPECRFTVEKYISPKTLSDETADGNLYDVYLLDMEMEELDGISLAAQIRKISSSCVIIFLSSHTEFRYTEEGYKVQAFRYVAKVMMETALSEALEGAIQVHQQLENAYYTYSYYSDKIRIPLREIIYVQRVKRMAVILTQSHGELSIKQPLKEVYAEMNDRRFVYIDRSCFVNVDHIIQLSKTEIVLQNKACLPVSRKMMPSVQSTVAQLWGGVK